MTLLLTCISNLYCAMFISIYIYLYYKYECEFVYLFVTPKILSRFKKKDFSKYNRIYFVPVFLWERELR